MGGRRCTTNNLSLLQIKHKSGTLDNSRSTSSAILASLVSRFSSCYISTTPWSLHHLSSSWSNLILPTSDSWSRHSFCDFASTATANNRLPETAPSILARNTGSYMRSIWSNAHGRDCMVARILRQENAICGHAAKAWGGPPLVGS